MEHTPGIRSVSRRQDKRLGRLHARLVARREEKGYVMVMTAILLPLLLMLVSAATDVTYFYARNVEVQRLADSAALAGVVRMPNFPDAKRIANRMATQNGAKSGTDDMTVTVDTVKGTNRQLRVTVRDANVELFFGSLIKDRWDITKSATAEYVSNIPLGSVLNQIGTGDLTATSGTVGAGLRPSSQNFWLTVHGPCAAKEQGDQVSTRYDGTWFNTSLDPASFPQNVPANRFRRICDYKTPISADPAIATTEQITQLAKEQSDAPDGLFPGVSLNREHDPEGYNYIVDVPCSNGFAAPCPDNDKISTPVNIDVFDPVFGPDSLQTQGTGGTKKIKPDGYGVLRLLAAGCTPTASNTVVGLDACKGILPGGADPGQVRPSDVRVTTEFRVYAADNSPVDTTDDKALELKLIEADSVFDGTNPDKTSAPKSVARFKSCVNATDWWMDDNGVQAADANKDYIPDTEPTTVPRIERVVPAGADERDAHCDRNSVQWRTLISLPAGSVRGRYRVNVRTASAPSSFGMNAFSLRASFGATPAATDVATFGWCHGVVPGTNCPSVSGDSTMSVSASVPAVSEFYLAQLAPARLFRGKTIVLQLWDIGEGGSKIELLRPVAGNSQCIAPGAAETVSDPVPNSVYCTQNFNWSIKDPGLNGLDPSSNLTAASSALSPTADPMGDNCTGSGKEEEYFLTVSDDWDNSLKNPEITTNCKSSFPTLMLKSRSGFSSSKFNKIVPATAGSGKCADDVTNPAQVNCRSGRFNDRLVSIEVQIPSTYGCKEGTGTSAANQCDESAPFVLPSNGWWKIRYTPLTANSGEVCTQSNSSGCLPITDATTWSVNLIGDPVHLVQNPTTP
jgi:Flp pilus assembly protein TadG